jgi:hypothetical protein
MMEGRIELWHIHLTLQSIYRFKYCFGIIQCGLNQMTPICFQSGNSFIAKVPFLPIHKTV